MFDFSDNNQIFAVSLATILIVARFCAFFVASPLLSRRTIPRLLALGLALAISLVCLPAAIPTLTSNDLHPTKRVILLIIKEAATGYLMGIVLWLPVRGLEMAGAILDSQRGSTQAQDFDVVFVNQTTPTAILLSQVFNGFFFSSGGFLIIVKLLYESLLLWPPSDFWPEISEKTLQLLLKFSGEMLLSGLIIVLPISVFMLLADIVISFIARSAPNLNALTFGMPVKSAILIIMLFSYFHILFPELMKTFSNGSRMMLEVLKP
ncbi:flagellar biosynthetic protein FliR [Ochrobactrum sp. Marseille-Q0166]|uniref:EscT/YscT/HrcT family type III secretion system export apparatus protein n=1 Tax=Ochrobactrum sp. Marseille-Q0166 TaxID=2761105 RepID=UPI001654EE3E|nr:flagellar biosynthetic protein FliR [Ochrobactrum sp. Marseille-Q0166]MBC8719599.1 flagellar biosynthetic protein FliR [Ochrobactrum sp. Marseille-Q0166]